MRWLSPLLLWLLAGCCDAPPQPAGFAAFIASVRHDAAAQGISPRTLQLTLDQAYYIQRAVSKDRNQPEVKITLDDYLGQRLTWLRLQRGQLALNEQQPLLAPLAERYGVPPAVLISLWGQESSYGTKVGSYPLIPALATLAFEGRRAAFFRKELLAALQIVEEGHIQPQRMTGSWAGAMGQAQLMPTSFLHYAVDGDGDGQRDIWGNNADVFASMANYLKRSGWRAGQPWGFEVVLPDELDSGLIGARQRQPLSYWQAQGFKPLAAQPWPADSSLPLRLIAPDGAAGRAFLVGRNYNALLAWNRSDYFALAIGLFADQLGEP